MYPWKILERINNTENKAEILSSIKEDDPFWLLSFALNPFIDKIVKLPMRDPLSYGISMDHHIFVKLVNSIINEELTGDNLVLTIEKFSQYCSMEEWQLWYRKILDNTIECNISIELFNQYAPLEFKVRILTFNYPTLIKSENDIPKNIIISPYYEGKKILYFINTKDHPEFIRGYTIDGIKYINIELENYINQILKKRVNIVIIGTLFNNEYILEDCIDYQQYYQELSTDIFSSRVEWLKILFTMGFEIAEFIPISNIQDLGIEYYTMIRQGYNGMVIHDAKATYPFHIKPDKFLKSIKSYILTFVDFILENDKIVGIKGNYKNNEIYVRLGLSNNVISHISDMVPGDKFAVDTCGFIRGKMLFPIFKEKKYE